MEQENETPQATPLDPVAEEILRQVQACAPGKSTDLISVAKAFAERVAKPGDPPDLWRKYLTAVRQQAIHLARQGRIVILRKKQPVDPWKPIKGVIRIANAQDWRGDQQGDRKTP